MPQLGLMPQRHSAIIITGGKEKGEEDIKVKGEVDTWRKEVQRDKRNEDM